MHDFVDRFSQSIDVVGSGGTWWLTSRYSSTLLTHSLTQPTKIDQIVLVVSLGTYLIALHDHGT